MLIFKSIESTDNRVTRASEIPRSFVSLDKGAFHTENTGICQTPVSEIPASTHMMNSAFHRQSTAIPLTPGTGINQNSAPGIDHSLDKP
ncbi:hypothetical protein T07_5993 [Trichinella nelsoni]|uniref:Uncharacterized protein n=1 Tax=Trichinella nelsoni TaxID=6336 RepID=A0A0V0RGS5_9BILA|nr:hypothetical protein T07_5993 [Trichinella nelsoni]